MKHQLRIKGLIFEVIDLISNNATSKYYVHNDSTHNDSTIAKWSCN